MKKSLADKLDGIAYKLQGIADDLMSIVDGLRKEKTVNMARSSVTGRTVTKAYAKAHPKTTEVERVRRP